MDIEQNYIKTIKFMNGKNCKMDTMEMSDFLQENNIPYIYFENTQDYFNYLNEDEPKENTDITEPDIIDTNVYDSDSTNKESDFTKLDDTKNNVTHKKKKSRKNLAPEEVELTKK